MRNGVRAAVTNQLVESTTLLGFLSAPEMGDSRCGLSLDFLLPYAAKIPSILKVTSQVAAVVSVFSIPRLRREFLALIIDALTLHVRCRTAIVLARCHELRAKMLFRTLASSAGETGQCAGDGDRHPG